MTACRLILFLFRVLVSTRIASAGLMKDLESSQKTALLRASPISFGALLRTKEPFVIFGNRMLENFVSWTDSDLVEIKKGQLNGGGIQGIESITPQPREKYNGILLIDEWSPLGAGKQNLHVAIKWHRCEIASSIKILISPQTDTATAAALTTLLWMDAVTSVSDPVLEVVYRRGLKEACRRPKGKAALLRIQRRISASDPASEILEEVLKNYDKGISD